MYDLGNQFRLDNTHNMADDSHIIKGKKYRFTVLSERLIRFEYSER